MKRLLIAAVAAGMLIASAPAASAVPSPTGWTRCGPLTYVVPQNDKFIQRRLPLLKKAFKEWGDATGLEFVYGGKVAVVRDGTRVETKKFLPRTIVIASAGKKVFPPEKVVGGGTAGWGGVSLGSLDGETYENIRGYALLNNYLKITPVFYPLLLHEIGHALDIGHSNKKLDIMYPVLSEQETLSKRDKEIARAVTRDCPLTEESNPAIIEGTEGE